jgi:hypothetical protein
MKRIGCSIAFALVLLAAAGAAYAVWPKYGLCFGKSRSDEIACVIRRNLHFSAHFTWTFNRPTIDAVLAEVGPEDLPALAKLLGDERRLVRKATGQTLLYLGDPGIAQLEAAARSPDPLVRETAEWALADYEIMKGSQE